MYIHTAITPTTAPNPRLDSKLLFSDKRYIKPPVTKIERNQTKIALPNILFFFIVIIRPQLLYCIIKRPYDSPSKHICTPCFPTNRSKSESFWSNIINYYNRTTVPPPRANVTTTKSAIPKKNFLRLQPVSLKHFPGSLNLFYNRCPAAYFCGAIKNRTL